MIKIEIGDITQCNHDIIVNSANPSLLAGGGVCGAIHKQAGPELEQATKKLDWCEVGEICHTDGFELNCKYVIHAVAPRFIYPEYHAPKEELLASCYTKSLDRARDLNVKSIAFPAIGIGIYGWSVEAASEITMNTIKSWLSNNSNTEIIVALIFSDNDVAEHYSKHIV